MLGLDRTRVELHDCHDEWRDAFRTEAARIRDELGDRVETVEQIGSTAIDGVLAKPVLDLLVTADEPRVTADADGVVLADELRGELESLGYTRREADVPGRSFFVRGPPEARTHYLSVAPHLGPFHREKVAFREYLRANPATAAAYARLKRELAADHAEDRTGYTDGKTAFVERVTETAVPAYAPDERTEN